MIWLVFALLTAAAAMSALAPLARARSRSAGSQRAADVAFYEAELANVSRELERGLISAQDAEAAKAEAARRLIGSGWDEVSQRSGSAVARRAAAIGSIVVIGAVSVGLYLRLGAPNYPDQPLAARLSAPPEKMDLMAAVAKIEAHLARNPEDGKGREVIAPVYMRMGRFEDAAKAWGEAIRLLGSTAQRETWRGEALTMAAQGKVTPEALAAFERALKLEPEAPQPRFYAGLAAEQRGDAEKARAIWTKLLAESPADAPWVAPIRARLAGGGEAAPAARGPNSEAGKAIAALPAEQRTAAIRGMVEGLAARLAQNGADADGWLRLVRAYKVLNEPEKAATALADARRALGADPAARARLDDLARELGIGG